MKTFLLVVAMMVTVTGYANNDYQLTIGELFFNVAYEMQRLRDVDYYGGEDQDQAIVISGIEAWDLLAKEKLSNEVLAYMEEVLHAENAFGLLVMNSQTGVDDLIVPLPPSHAGTPTWLREKRSLIGPAGQFDCEWTDSGKETGNNCFCHRVCGYMDDWCKVCYNDNSPFNPYNVMKDKPNWIHKYNNPRPVGDLNPGDVLNTEAAAY